MSLTEVFRADLHVHTHFSDGTDSPSEILEKAKKKGLSGLSFTDHDTTEVYEPSLFSLAKSKEISLLPGVEVSSKWEEEEVHILGYGFDTEKKDFQDFLRRIREKRKERNQKILQNLQRQGIQISEEELYAFPRGVIGRPHIALLLQQKGVVSSFQEAFDLYLKKGASCFVMGEKVPALQAIEQIQKAHGKAILAHPHFLRDAKMIRELLKLPFDGIECYYAYFSREKERKWLEIAEEKGWISTGGSDYHGSIKPMNVLASSWVGWETFQRLMKNG